MYRKGKKPQGSLYSRHQNLKYSKDKICHSEEKEVLLDKPMAASIPVEDIVECETSQKWLQYHNEPFSEVLAKWEFTYNFRRRMLENMELDEIFGQWPILKSPKADALVNSLFVCVFLIFL